MITTNTGAKKIEGTDNWRGIFDAHNDSVDAHDQAITKLEDESVYYGTCSTAASTQQKAVTASNFPSALKAGQKLRVVFTNAQTYNGQPTLKVNSLAAVNICKFGTTAAARYEWQAGQVLDFIYDGTNWIIVDGELASGNYPGKVKLTDNYSSTSPSAASTGIAASHKAVADAYTMLNGKLANEYIVQNAYLTSHIDAGSSWSTVKTGSVTLPDGTYLATLACTIKTPSSGSATLRVTLNNNGGTIIESNYTAEGAYLTSNAVGEKTLTAATYTWTIQALNCRVVAYNHISLVFIKVL